MNMTDAINKVEYYNPTLDKWYEAGPLKKSRSLVGVTVLRGTLYAVSISLQYIQYDYSEVIFTPDFCTDPLH